jgi:hypothetical protein
MTGRLKLDGRRRVVIDSGSSSFIEMNISYTH